MKRNSRTTSSPTNPLHITNIPTLVRRANAWRTSPHFVIMRFFHLLPLFVADTAAEVEIPTAGKHLKMPNYGGQAIIEGVLMRGRRAVAMAIRKPDGEIHIHTERLSRIYQSPIMKVPFLRGIIGLWDALVLGTRALTYSANMQLDEEEQLEGWGLYLSLGLSLLVGVALFTLLPAGLGHWVQTTLGLSPLVGNLIEGLVRLGLLIAYIWGIGLMDDVRRLYMYHGAEHKTINAFEAGAPLTPESTARYPLEHPRCGTAFLLILVLVSVVAYSLLGEQTLFWRFASRLLLLPLLAGVAYEYLRWTADHMNIPWVRAIVQPNLWLQHLTTREPTHDILEVGIASFQAMRAAEEGESLATETATDTAEEATPDAAEAPVTAD